MSLLFILTLLIAGPKIKEPELVLRASPQMAIGPVEVLFTAELKGGEDTEKWHCLKQEWEWPDGTLSTKQSDCEPFSGKIDRRWNERRMVGSGDYEIFFRLYSGKKRLAETSVKLMIR